MNYKEQKESHKQLLKKIDGWKDKVEKGTEWYSDKIEEINECFRKINHCCERCTKINDVEKLIINLRKITNAIKELAKQNHELEALTENIQKSFDVKDEVLEEYDEDEEEY